MCNITKVLRLKFLFCELWDFFFRFRVGAGGWDEKSSEYDQLTGHFQSLFLISPEQQN